MVTIEETLKGSDVDSALSVGPYLIYAEVLEGARRPLAFLEAAGEDTSLIGKAGNTIKFLKASQLSATHVTEANMIGSGMSAGDKTMSAVSVSVTGVIYSAVELSDILMEDYPNIDWVRLHLRNMGKAVMEYLDADTKDVIQAASGTATKSCSDLSYDTIIDALAALENNNFVPDPRNPPYLIASPDAVAALMKDTKFVTSERYTAYEISRMVEGEAGHFAGCRVLKSSLLDGTGHAYIIFPSDAGYGPIVTVVWKRRLTVKNDYIATKGYTYFVTTIRAKAVVVQPEGICKISITNSP